jgi:hypothetical protein
MHRASNSELRTFPGATSSYFWREFRNRNFVMPIVNFHNCSVLNGAREFLSEQWELKHKSQISFPENKCISTGSMLGYNTTVREATML